MKKRTDESFFSFWIFLAIFSQLTLQLTLCLVQQCFPQQWRLSGSYSTIHALILLKGAAALYLWLFQAHSYSRWNGPKVLQGHRQIEHKGGSFVEFESLKSQHPTQFKFLTI